MTQPSIKLARLRDNKPVKLGIAIEPDLMSDLDTYAKIYEAVYGEPQSVAALIPSMLRGFITSDAGYKKARRNMERST